MVGRKKKQEEIKKQAQTLRQAMVVRHRSDGYLRLEIPVELRTTEAALTFQEDLGSLDGVYRVLTYNRAGKISIRWMPEVVSLKDIAECLTDAVEKIIAGKGAKPKAFTVEVEDDGGVFSFVTRPYRRAKAQYQDLRNKAKTVYDVVAARNALVGKIPFEPEAWAITFINDLVVFYLIKVHWNRIINQWLPNPIRYRYEWLTVFYLTFLLVRHRKTTQAAKAQLSHKAQEKA